MHDLPDRRPLGAMRAAVERTVPGRLLAGPHPVLHLRRHRAADRAVRTDVLSDLDRNAGLRRADRFGLLDRAKLKTADGREPADSQAGATQEGAAVDRLGPDRGCDGLEFGAAR